MSGPESWPVRRPLLLGAAALVVLLGGFGLWAGAARISGAIIAPGRIEVERSRQVVQHPDGGVVAEIRVDEGDRVSAGQVLIRLDRTRLASRLAIIEGQLFEVMARRARLAAERDGRGAVRFDDALILAARSDPAIADLIAGQERLFAARRDSLSREVDQLQRRRAQIENQIEGIDAQQHALTRQLALLGEELEAQQTLLDKGLAQSGRVLALRRELASLRGAVGELTATRAQARGRITEIEVAIIQLHSRRREGAIARLRDIRSRELELAERRRSLRDQLGRLEIRAPVSGVVYGLRVFAPRSVIRAADPLLYIVPQDRPLVIEARIDPIHIEQSFVGQEVTLRFTSVDHRTTPELAGTVVRISADAFVDERTSASFYRARIELPEMELARLPENVALIPGMPVEAYLRTGERTPIAFLVKPLADYFARAFRES